MEITLPIVRGSGGVGGEIVLTNATMVSKNKLRRKGWERTYHATRICGRIPVDECSPNVEVLANSPNRISPTSVAKVGASLNIVLVQERETHVLIPFD